MFAFIQGTLQYAFKDYLIIEAQGVGYKVFTAHSTLCQLPLIGEKVKIHTHLHVREDAMMLYGFMTPEELQLFELLITVSGIGPKVALGVLSSIRLSEFSLLVMSGDAKGLTKAPGIGLKTAQRIILDLKDKINSQQPELELTVPAAQENPVQSEAVSALMVLGYGTEEASKAIEAIYTTSLPLEQIIKKALQVLSR